MLLPIGSCGAEYTWPDCARPVPVHYALVLDAGGEKKQCILADVTTHMHYGM